MKVTFSYLKSKELFSLFASKLKKMEPSFKYLTGMNFIKFPEVFQNMFYLLKQTKPQINKPKTNLLDWRKMKSISSLNPRPDQKHPVRGDLRVPIRGREQAGDAQLHVHRSGSQSTRVPARRKSQGVLLPGLLPPPSAQGI